MNRFSHDPFFARWPAGARDPSRSGLDTKRPAAAPSPKTYDLRATLQLNGNKAELELRFWGPWGASSSSSPSLTYSLYLEHHIRPGPTSAGKLLGRERYGSESTTSSSSSNSSVYANRDSE